MRFRTTILQNGRTATGIHVPDEVVASLGAGKRPKVSVTINGYTYRSSVAPWTGASWSASARRYAKVPASQAATRSMSTSNSTPGLAR